MNSWERMSEEKSILYDQCNRLWMPVFFGSFLFIYTPIGLLLGSLSGGGEVVGSVYAIGAMILAALTAPVVDAVYFEIRDRSIMRRYREGKAQEEAANG